MPRSGIDGSIEGRDCLVEYRRNGRVLAAASIYRDLANLRGELAMERACNELGNLPAHNRKTRGVASP